MRVKHRSMMWRILKHESSCIPNTDNSTEWFWDTMSHHISQQNIQLNGSETQYHITSHNRTSSWMVLRHNITSHPTTEHPNTITWCEWYTQYDNSQQCSTSHHYQDATTCTQTTFQTHHSVFHMHRGWFDVGPCLGAETPYPLIIAIHDSP